MRKITLLIIALLAVTAVALAQNQTINGNLHVEGDIYSKNWVRVNGNQGLYFQSWGGGFYMLDANWIRTYGNKGFYHNTGIMRTDGIFHVGPDGNRLIVNTNGNIGIGTSNPRALLDIGNLSRNKLKSVLARSDEGNNDGEGT
ncbi:MAG: shufflon system plasmid conjugative transfer pilus tip adhesin PilV, partial [Prevotella sp.]|nr:shufflon system plasmid conjugative transfer pilus tip adhesin PilV [Prevotella sp.]